MTQKFRLGMKGKLFQGPGGSTGVPTTELDNVKDVTLTLDAAEADVTTRANSGFRATVSGLKECTIEWAMQYKVGDAGFKAIREAWYTASEIASPAPTPMLRGISANAAKSSLIINGILPFFSFFCEKMAGQPLKSA